MDKAELRKMICEAESRQKIRGAKTIGGFAVAYFLGFWILDKPPADVKEFLAMVAVSLFLAFIHVCINSTVFDHVLSANKADQELIKDLKKKLDNTP